MATAKNMNLALVGEAWGAWEERGAHPFCGTSGVMLFEMLCDAEICRRTAADTECIKDFWWFWRQHQIAFDPAFIEPRPMMRLWAAHPEVTLLNVFNIRPKDNNLESLFTSRALGVTALPGIKGKYLSPAFLPHVTALVAALDSINPNLTVCLGGTASWALLRNSSITKIRGAIAKSVVGAHKCLPTFHPAGVLRQYDLRHVTVLDLHKARREMIFPEIRRPKRTIYVPETIDDLYWIRKNWTYNDDPVSVDIETAGEQITTVGFAQTPDLIYSIPFRFGQLPYWKTVIEERVAWETAKILADSPNPKVFQNALFDINRCWTQYKIVFRNIQHDTMLAQHSTYIESPKGLDFLGSCYTNEPAWKLMRKHKDLKKED